MAPRKRPVDPFNAVVDEIRHLMVSRRWSNSISDDMDMYYVKAAGYSPMERLGNENAKQTQRAEQLASQLVAAGVPAADAVARGLRMQGSWRVLLIPFAEQRRDVPIVRAALELVARRKRDPLASTAQRVLAP